MKEGIGYILVGAIYLLTPAIFLFAVIWEAYEWMCSNLIKSRL